MDALASLLDSLAWPQYPSAPGAQAAFIAAAVAILIGLFMLIFPVTSGKILRLESRETRPGAIGELRASGGFLLGLAVSALMFEQPPFYTALGLAFAVSAFGRVISLMSDRAASLVNVLLLFLQVALAGALLYYFFDVFTPGMDFGLPDELKSQLAFYTYVAIAVLGTLMMFAPRISSYVVGIDGITDAGFTSVRSAGGFALGASLLGILLVGSPHAREAPFEKMLYINLAFAVALAFAVIGRLIALAFNRGNYIYAIVALLVEAAVAAIMFAYVAALM
jgi:hypothetical protein